MPPVAPLLPDPLVSGKSSLNLRLTRLDMATARSTEDLRTPGSHSNDPMWREASDTLVDLKYWSPSQAEHPFLAPTVMFRLRFAEGS
jgi:hypothetical protein